MKKKKKDTSYQYRSETRDRYKYCKQWKDNEKNFQFPVPHVRSLEVASLSQQQVKTEQTEKL